MLYPMLIQIVGEMFEIYWSQMAKNAFQMHLALRVNFWEKLGKNMGVFFQNMGQNMGNMRNMRNMGRVGILLLLHMLFQNVCRKIFVTDLSGTRWF